MSLAIPTRHLWVSPDDATAEGMVSVRRLSRRAVYPLDLIARPALTPLEMVDHSGVISIAS